MTITVNLPGLPPASLGRTFSIPVELPPVTFPSVFLLSRHDKLSPYAGHDGGILIVVLRPGTPLKTLGDLIAALNGFKHSVLNLAGMLGWTPGLGDLLNPLEVVIDCISSVPEVNLIVGVARDLEEFSDFNDQASSLLLLGAPEASVTVYRDTDFDVGEGRSVIRAKRVELPGPIRIQAPLGIAYRDALKNYRWDVNDLGDMDDAIQSVHWGAENDPAPAQSPAGIPVDPTT
ncbi:hypothetical protein AB0K09_14770 [Streptomyces sp. NPDC049577]|uniref:hypothetical protein n=1 Tax=Streptomyces sp. NPDC049577 TaxID=3155153 RepID=UPI0034278002